MPRNIIERIKKFNQGRQPDGLTLKYKLMQTDSYAFFRGTCHLFYEDWPKESSLNHAPPVWISGDLHMQNFGCYKGDNRLVYFDLNDFDESALAPCTWEVGRLLTSIHLVCHSLKIPSTQATVLTQRCLSAYASSLAEGKAQVIELETAEGLVGELMGEIKARRRKDFLEKKTVKKGDKRKLLVDGKHAREATPEEKWQVTDLLRNWAVNQTDPGFYKIIDIAHRIAGVGSLGIDRFVILVEGKGSPDKNYLLDLKEELPSSLIPFLKLPQPSWPSEADRVIAIQKRAQGTNPALLAPVLLQGKSYVLHELQPYEDKVDFTAARNKETLLDTLIRNMSEVTAWSHLRSSGRQGSAIADRLIEFGQASDWQEELCHYAAAYAHQVEEDYQEYCLTPCIDGSK
jgi:uncharacterized protein (DUF2252 family)